MLWTSVRPGWLLGGVAMTHSTERQLFIPPGLRIIHVYASESRLFSRAAAILQAGQQPSITQGTGHFQERQHWRIFRLDVPIMEPLEKGGKMTTRRQKVLLQQARKHKTWKSSWGLHRHWQWHQRGPAKVSSKWKEPCRCMVKATLTDALHPAAKKTDTLGQFPLFCLFFKIKDTCDQPDMADQEGESRPFPIFLAQIIKGGNGFPRWPWARNIPWAPSCDGNKWEELQPWITLSKEFSEFGQGHTTHNFSRSYKA